MFTFGVKSVTSNGAQSPELIEQASHDWVRVQKGANVGVEIRSR